MPQYFPTGYNPTYGYAHPYMSQPYPTSYSYTQNPVGQTVQNAQPTQQMTPPTIRAEIIQVEDQQVVDNYPVAAGCTQMFMSKDDKFIFIKTAYPNAPYDLTVYEKKDKPKQEPVIQSSIDTDKFITRDEFENRINDILKSQKPYKHKNYDKSTQPQTQVREDVQNG